MQSVVKTLPDGPCLVIEWIAQDNDNNWIAEYYLRLPVKDGDCRIPEDEEGRRIGEPPYFIKVKIGSTKCNGHYPYRRGSREFDLPFRDGAHMCWDARELRLPAFVMFCDEIHHVDEWAYFNGTVEATDAPR